VGSRHVSLAHAVEDELAAAPQAVSAGTRPGTGGPGGGA
jgi:hypothetical protein